VADEQLIVDPGPDFAKTPDESVEVMRDLGALQSLGFRGEARAAMVAVSRFPGTSRGRGAAEGLRLAGEHGVGPELVLPVIERSTGANWVAANWETVLGWWRDYEPGGSLDIIVKDMRSLLDDAAERHLPLPVAAVAFQRLHDVWR